MKTVEEIVTLEVEGMTCTNCALGVTKTLEKAGLTHVHADFASGEVVYSNVSALAKDAVINKIEALGYKVKNQGEDTHNHAHSINKWGVEQKFWFSLAFTVPLMLHMVFPHTSFINNPWLQLGLSLPVVIVGILHFGRSAWGSLKSGVPNMDVLIFIGFTAAFGYSIWGTLSFDIHTVHNYLFYETAASIITLVLLGNVLEHRATMQTATAVKDLGQIQNTIARRVAFINGVETLVEVPNSEIYVGDILQVNTGDRIPADGAIIKGEASIDEAIVTGESMPVDKGPKDPVVGGTVVTSGSFRMQAKAVGNQTVIAAIIKMVKEAQRDKPSIQRLGDRVSAVFVPVVVGIAILTFFIAHFAFNLSTQQALMNAIAVLVISCPCAMGLATPTAVMAGIGRAAKNGIFIKGGRVLEEFANIKTIVFDKTGTLTTGKFKVKDIQLAEGVNRQDVIDITVELEKHSSHPIAQSIVAAFKADAKPIVLTNVSEEKGLGMKGILGDDIYQLGSEKIVSTANSLPLKGEGQGGGLYLLKNNNYIASFIIEDTIKPGTATVIKELNTNGIETVLLSGDTEQRTDLFGKQIGITTILGQKTPAEKLQVIKSYTAKNSTAMVGDGINDAPALSAAHVGISISGATSAALSSASIVLSNKEDLAQLALAHKIAKHTLITIKQNLFWAFFYNVVAIPIAAVGLLNPMIAAGAMAFSDVIVIGNSIRLKSKKLK
jgi:P-type Cu+ transporter